MTVCGVTSELCGEYSKQSKTHFLLLAEHWDDPDLSEIFQNQQPRQAQLCKSQNKISKILYLKLLYH